jgi:hypothetical protein
MRNHNEPIGHASCYAEFSVEKNEMLLSEAGIGKYS